MGKKQCTENRHIVSGWAGIPIGSNLTQREKQGLFAFFTLGRHFVLTGEFQGGNNAGAKASDGSITNLAKSVSKTEGVPPRLVTCSKGAFRKDADKDRQAV